MNFSLKTLTDSIASMIILVTAQPSVTMTMHTTGRWL